MQREGKVRAFANDATTDSQVRDFASVTVDTGGSASGGFFHGTIDDVRWYETASP